MLGYLNSGENYTASFDCLSVFHSRTLKSLRRRKIRPHKTATADLVISSVLRRGDRIRLQIWREEEAKDEPDEADAAVDEEGPRVAEMLHEVDERLGDDEGARERETDNDGLAHLGDPRWQQPLGDHPQQGAVPDVA